MHHRSDSLRGALPRPPFGITVFLALTCVTSPLGIVDTVETLAVAQVCCGVLAGGRMAGVGGPGSRLVTRGGRVFVLDPHGKADCLNSVSTPDSKSLPCRGDDATRLSIFLQE